MGWKERYPVCVLTFVSLFISQVFWNIDVLDLDGERGWEEV